MTQSRQIDEDNQQSLTQAVHPASNLYTALTTLLSSVCASTDWEYGESWIPCETDNILELTPAWCRSTNLDMHRAIAWMQFQICSKAFVLHPAEGLPGRVWLSQQPEWLIDASVQSETYFLRNQIAKAFGVKAGFGVPIVIDSKVLAVVVFFMSQPRSEDKHLVEQTQAAIANSLCSLPN